jgi:SAM-dependent methyltransferase
VYGLGEGQVDLAIDGRDEMYRHNLYDHLGSRELALTGYFQGGYSAYRTVRGILRSCFPEERFPSLRVLDFASGYGRLTRYLLRDLQPEQLTIAEIDPEAVAFQRDHFGVRGVVSTPTPEALELDPEAHPETDRFDAIVVSSLFSHLPRTTFEGWLRRLYGLLAPGGVLILSVHDAAAMLPGRTLPEDGFYFEAQSESEFLELEAYGSAWVSEGYMARRLAEISGGRARYQRLPFALWHWQDLYVVGEGEAMLEIRAGRGVQGAVDVLPVGRSPALRLQGWAVDHALPGAAGEVRLTLDGEELARIQPQGHRPDVPGYLGNDAFLHSGWAITLDPPPRSDALLMVTATGREGPTVLHAGSIDSSVLASLRRQDRRTMDRLRDIAERRRLALGTTRAHLRGLRAMESLCIERGYRAWELEQRIAAMEASRFWKVRNLWFRLKGKP